MRIFHLPARWLAVAFAAALACSPALAEKDDKHGKHDKHEWKADKEDRKADKRAEKEHRKAEKHARKHDGDGPRHGQYFEHRHREVVHHYYVSHKHGKSCPPGLARKDNGCMPPGHAKRWEVGKPLPPTVVVYSVPQPILVSLPPPPPQHKYVRVAGDILLIAAGTSMVVDGISGLTR